MRKSAAHLSKTPQERDYYNRYIKKQDYEQTVDQGISFPESDISDKDFEVEHRPRKRRRKIGDQLSDHFENNWLKWVIGGITIFISIFIYNFKLRIASNEIDIKNVNEDVKSLEIKVDKQREILYEHDTQIEIAKIKLDDLKNASLDKADKNTKK